MMLEILIGGFVRWLFRLRARVFFQFSAEFVQLRSTGHHPFQLLYADVLLVEGAETASMVEHC